MTPSELAKSGTEHGEQRALIAWCNIAERYGWRVADDPRAYTTELASLTYPIEPMPQLHWFHAIHNQRDANNAVAGAKAKAEGVKKGVADLFLPVPTMQYAGLYIEMKKADGNYGDLKPEQKEFAEYCKLTNYKFECCFGWRNARSALLYYLGVAVPVG